MVVDDGSEPANVDPVLVRLLVRAHAIRAGLLEDPSLTLKEIAADEGVVSSYVSRLARLAFLAPDIVTANDEAAVLAHVGWHHGIDRVVHEGYPRDAGSDLMWRRHQPAA